ncbi:uncharacterized protein Gasu_35720 [Galdieria sulphuraria]|uniref:Uncharacterized protein n=1 Tax=Galdieria sulphuraria TaxID=130081 RepID=M2W062_GALSU|nr:uncharacterized protein Gasu_35720 [Galdieria sulphuraria]EME29001.1 hypothetical protein Gasu_35720 [Galdieria sulphuraria]|eukprot:XP_005705521.1 hypothetical protein Gasu_35720 [Galdieria sulphuraria]
MWAFIHGLSWKENIRTNTLGNLTEASHVNKRVKVAPLTIEAGKGARWKGAKWAAKKRPKKLRPSDKFRKPPSYEVDPIRALKDPPPEYTIVSQAESTSDIQIESAVEQDS